MPIILPTHTCFTDALEYLAARVAQDPRLRVWHRTTLRLVHGICLIPIGQVEAGEPFAHAWIEEAGRCLTMGLLDGRRVLVQREHAEFYRQLRVQDRTIYTIRQAWRENARTGMYGPWRADYLALCRPSLGREDARALDVAAAGPASSPGRS